MNVEAGANTAGQPPMAEGGERRSGERSSGDRSSDRAGGDPVAAITERDATGEIAACYADIRETLGVPVVNLVWRHLATIEGALPWAWRAVRPAYINGAVDRAAARLKAQLHLPALPVMAPDVLACLGLSAADTTGIRAVLTAYDRSNPMNWLALSALLGLAQAPSAATLAADHRVAHTGSEPPGEAATMPSALPRLLSLDAMAPPVASLVLRLDTLGNPQPAPILASMYRHLSHWPAFLALLWAQLSALDAQDQLSRARDQVDTCGAREVIALTIELNNCSIISSAPAGAQAALHDFLSRVGLPRMIAVTTMARASLG